MVSQSDFSMAKLAPVKSSRVEYIKIYLKPSELKVLEHKEKRVSEIYKAKDSFYNRPNHFRLFMLNLDNPDLLALLDSFSEEDKKTA